MKGLKIRCEPRVALIACLNAGARTITNSGSGHATLTTSSGAISDGNGGGTLAITHAGLGTLIITRNQTYSGGTTITGGTLQLGDGASNNGSIANSVVDKGTFAVANANDQTFSGSI